MLQRVLPFFIFLFIPLAAAAGNPVESAVPPTTPSLSIREALEIADRYTKDHGIDLSEQYIASVVLRFDAEAKKQSCWHIQWRRSMPRIGGEYGLCVYMDRSVKEARLGP